MQTAHYITEYLANTNCDMMSAAAVRFFLSKVSQSGLHAGIRTGGTEKAQFFKIKSVVLQPTNYPAVFTMAPHEPVVILFVSIVFVW
jgi:hypothetical protein